MKDRPDKASPNAQPAFLFDLDGTLIDSVYQHVLAFHEALNAVGVDLPCWAIHRRIGMSDDLIVPAFARDAGVRLGRKQMERVRELHGEAYMLRVDEVPVLPGAKTLLKTLKKFGVPYAIGTSSKRERTVKSLKMLGVGEDVPVITGDEVSNAKPNPDLFLASAAKLKVEIIHCIVIGDSVWDLLAARRARALGVGLLCGGFGEDELIRAGAYRVYRDPEDLAGHLDELGVQS
ncbi:MAG TPA: HAD family phosphatase [Terriglobales bacterium]|jgi:HAD superfamily hydrolase (TIGR01549 family)